MNSSPRSVIDAGSMMNVSGAAGNVTLMNCGSFSVNAAIGAGACASCVNDQLPGMKVSAMLPVPSVPDAQKR